VTNLPFDFSGFEGADLGEMFRRIGDMLSYDGSVHWQLAHDTARQVVAQGTDPSIGDRQRDQVAESVRIAETWLDGSCTLPAAGVSAAAWSRAEWIEATFAGWQEMVTPIATRIVQATSTSLPESLPEGLASGPMGGMLQKMGGAMFAGQMGQGLALLANEVLGAADVGIPLTTPPLPALVPTNVDAFGDGLSIDSDEVRLYVALREAAHQRLFAHATWLRSRIQSAIEEYARGITVDTSQIESLMATMDPSNPEALQETLASGMVQPPDTPEQKAALARLETLLALIEGWVDAVVHDAAAGRLSSADALHETVRRRRATGGPAESTFSALVGLELRPRRLREAATLWSTLAEQRGREERDNLWSHPDLLPSSDDLDDVEGFVSRQALDLSGLEDIPSVPEDEPNE
jgi:putative hydrolase